MKTALPIHRLWLFCLLYSAFCLSIAAQTTAFTYQGRLTDNGAMASGVYDLRFELFDAATAGSSQGSLTNTAVAVSNGLFTVALDFGTDVFDGSDLWLEIAATTNVGETFTTLSPRQQITSTPYALKAMEAATVPAGSITENLLAPVLSADLARLSGDQVFDGGLEAGALQINDTGNNSGTASGAAVQVSGGGLLPFLDATFLGSAVEGENGITNLVEPFPIAADQTDVFVPSFANHSVTWISMADPANPVQVATIVDDSVDPASPFTRLRNPRNVAFHSSHLYIAANDALTIAERSGTSLVKVAEVLNGDGQFNRLSSPTSVAVVGTNAYVTAESSLTIIDVSDPANPVLLSEISDDSVDAGSPFTHLSRANHVVVTGNVAFVTAVDDRALNLIDVSDPANPVLLGAAVDESLQPGSAFTRLTGATHVAVHEEMALVTASVFSGQNDHAVTIIDVSTPANPQLVAVMEDDSVNPASPFAFLRFPWDVKVVTSPTHVFAIVSSFNDSAVSFIDITDPANPVPAGVLRSGFGDFLRLGGAGGMVLVGTRLYVAGFTHDSLTAMELGFARMGLSVDQRVGIGTTNPSERLHVEGNVLASGTMTASEMLGDQFRSFNPDNTAASVSLGWLDNTARIRIGGTGGVASGAQNGLDIQTVGNNSLMRLMGNGNVGIGATNPVERLHVDGNILATGAVKTDSIQVNENTLSIGTAENQPLEIKLNGLRVLRFEDNGDGPDIGTIPDGAPNIIGGSPVNFVAPGVFGATIAGGGTTNTAGLVFSNSIHASYAAIGGGQNNHIQAGSSFSTVAGGSANRIASNSPSATIAGGFLNRIDEDSRRGAIGGGEDNIIAPGATFATIAGGHGNGVGGSGGTIGGGGNNTANGINSTVPGGTQNRANGHRSFAAGAGAQALHDGAFVWSDSTGGDFASTGDHQFNVRAIGGVRIVTGGTGMTVDGANVALLNAAQTFTADLSLGSGSQILADVGSASAPGYSFGGDANSGMFRPGADSLALATAGTERMRINSVGNVGIGTASPQADLHVRGVGSTGMLTVTPNTSDSRSQLLLTENTSASIGFIMRYDGDVGSNPLRFIPLVAGAENAPVMTLERSGDVGIGTDNPQRRLHVRDGSAGLSPNSNTALVVERDTSTFINVLTPDDVQSGVLFGQPTAGNAAGGVIYNSGATPNGFQFRVNGNITRMVLDASGNVGIGTTTPTHPIHHSSGAHLTAAGAWTSVSDRAAKEQFEPVDPVEVLNQLAALPISRWKYKAEAEGVNHLGPVAQDFHASFELGEGETTIAGIDADGVALAAIQGLNRKLEQRLEQKETEITELRQTVNELKELVQAMNRKLNRVVQ